MAMTESLVSAPARASSPTPAAVSTGRGGRQSTAWLGLLLAAACVFPFVFKGYALFQATLVMAYAVALLGLNILTGYNGQVSLGHGAFFAVGAYAAAILMEHAGLHYALAIPAAGLICLVAGFLFGFPALKLEGLYLALATFALAIVLPQLLKYRLFEPWTGGVQGIVLIKPEPPAGLPLDADQWLYFVGLAITLLMFLLGYNLLAGGVGRALKAIRDNPLAAETMGVDNRFYKTATFGISAAYTGIGGALFAIAVQFVSGDAFTIFLSISMLVGIVVGGVGTLSGAFYGAVFIMFVPQAAEKISKSAPWTVYGVVLIASVFLMPRGVAGAVRYLRNRFAEH